MSDERLKDSAVHDLTWFVARYGGMSMGDVIGRLREQDAEMERLAGEVAIDDKLIAERNRLLDMFECPDHGQCVPYAMLEVERLRADLAGYDRRPEESFHAFCERLENGGDS